MVPLREIPRGVRREPLAIDEKSRGRLHTVPFRLRRDKIVVRARVNGGMAQDFILESYRGLFVTHGRTFGLNGDHMVFRDE